MQFEHLVQVNDRTLVDLPVLDRLQLWEGLVCRARSHSISSSAWSVSRSSSMTATACTGACTCRVWWSRTKSC